MNIPSPLKKALLGKSRPAPKAVPSGCFDQQAMKDFDPAAFNQRMLWTPLTVRLRPIDGLLTLFLGCQSQRRLSASCLERERIRV